MSAIEAFGLKGQVAIVTGGGAGIGRAISELFAAAGAAVVVSDLDKDAADDTASAIASAGGRAIGVACDVTNADAREALVDAAITLVRKDLDPRQQRGRRRSQALRHADGDLRLGLRAQRVLGVPPVAAVRAAHREGGRRRDPEHHARWPARTRTSRMASYASSKAAENHLTRNIAFDLGPTRHPRQRHRPGRDQDRGARERAHARHREGDAQAHAARPARRRPRTSPTRRCSCARPPPAGSAARS